MSLINETDLHHKIVEFIHNRYPDVLIVAGLGENHITSEMRLESWRKGTQRASQTSCYHKRVGAKCASHLN